MNTLYYYNGNLRWSFYWENPNYWAMFLVFVLIGSWAVAYVVLPRLRAPGFIKYIVCAFELLIWFLMAKTYSRGGLVAAAAALLLFFILEKRIQSAGIRAANILARLVVVAVICVCVGGAGRISPDYVVQDRSVLNRMDMWQGALVMMKDSPWTGWGNHLGGFSYINWYQPMTANERPVGFVNSYLDVAVEFGAPALCMTLWIFFFLLIVALRHRKSHETMPAFVILASWGLGNVWSSLWRETLLWIIPIGCVLYLLTVCYRARFLGTGNPLNEPKQSDERPSGRRRPILMNLALAFALSVGIVVVLLSMGRAFSGKYGWIACPSRGTDKITLIKRHSVSDTADAPEIFMDGAVFGRYFGKTFRSIAAATTREQFQIYPPWAQNPKQTTLGTKLVVYSGFHASWLAERCILSSHKTVILHPTVHPPHIQTTDNRSTRILLCVPLAEASEHTLAWRRWAGKNDVQIINSSHGGLRIDPEGNTEFWRQLLER